MEAPKLTRWQRIRLELLWGGMRLFALLPYWFKYYVVGSFLFVVLGCVVRYRSKVVWANLHRSFPEKSERE